MANITTTEVTNSIPTIIAAQALGYLKANTVLAQLVRRDWDNEVAQFGNTIKIPYGGTLSANNKSANTVVTLQTPTDAVYTVTLNKHKEVSFLIEDIARAFARPDWVQVYMAQSMAVLAEQIDSDIAALYAGFSGSVDATTGLDESDFREARRLLSAAKAPLTDRFVVLSEDADKEALAIEKLTNRDYQGDPAAVAVQEALLGKLYGFRIYMDQRIVSSGGQSKNMFFHRDALALATRPLPLAPAALGVMQSVMAEDGVGLRVTMSYDHDYLGAKFTVDVLYGVANLRANHGVTVSTTDPA